MVTPVASDEYVYGGAQGVGGGIVRLKAKPDGVGADEVYFARGLPNNIGGSVLVGNYLYGTAGDSLVAVEFATGTIKWKADCIGGGSVACADGMLFVHGENGQVALVEATPDAYREKGRFTPPLPPKRRKLGPFPERAWTYPVIANGRLYIRDIGTLWAFDVKRSH
jgi:outer membrane protein assembly factor BamB